MEFVDGINVDNFKKIRENNIDVAEVCALLSNCFSKQIFKYGVVHGDPHSGNVFVRKARINGKIKPQIVLLDHGLYKYLGPELRLNYAYLWKGIITQDEKMIENSVKQMGIKDRYMYRLFTGMVTGMNWDDIMDKNEANLKERLDVPNSNEFKTETSRKMKMRFKQIVHCLQKIDQDLLLIFKVNDYLRSLDNRLGRPINTFYYTVSNSC